MSERSISGAEKNNEAERLACMDLAVHGLEGDMCHGGEVSSPHKAVGAFDFVLANPPFNVNAVDKDRFKDAVDPGRRFPLRPAAHRQRQSSLDQFFCSSFTDKDRAAFVMADSASDGETTLCEKTL